MGCLVGIYGPNIQHHMVTLLEHHDNGRRIEQMILREKTSQSLFRHDTLALSTKFPDGLFCAVKDDKRISFDDIQNC